VTKEIIYKKYELLYINLKDIIATSEQRVIFGEPDLLFSQNVNFFVKSYLISICSYLEAMLQELALIKSKEINSRLLNANIPHNYLLWRLGANVKEKDWVYSHTSLQIPKDEISDNLSANPYRTIKLFQKLGVNLDGNEEFQNNKDLVNSIVTKRNNIIHHNDRAADVSFGDLISYIDIFLLYGKAITASI